MATTRRKNQSPDETRVYRRSVHKSIALGDKFDCPEPGRLSHSGDCVDQPMAEKSESVRTRQTAGQAEPAEVEKSGRGNTTRATRGGNRRKATKAEKVTLGDLTKQPMAAFIFPLDDQHGIIGFDVGVNTNVNYTKFAFGDECTDDGYDNGDLVISRQDNVNFQVHNDGAGMEDGSYATILVIPSLKIDWNKITIGDLFDDKNHLSSV